MAPPAERKKQFDVTTLRTVLAFLLFPFLTAAVVVGSMGMFILLDADQTSAVSKSFLGPAIRSMTEWNTFCLPLILNAGLIGEPWPGGFTSSSSSRGRTALRRPCTVFVTIHVPCMHCPSCVLNMSPCERAICNDCILLFLLSGCVACIAYLNEWSEAYARQRVTKKASAKKSE